MKKLVYILDTFNHFSRWDREHTVYTFQINDVMYAIKEVELEWGIPKLPFSLEEQYSSQYHIWSTKEEALQFVIRMKALNTV